MKHIYRVTAGVTVMLLALGILGTGPAQATTSSVYIDCNEKVLNSYGKVSRPLPLPSVATDAFVCIWKPGQSGRLTAAAGIVGQPQKFSAELQKSVLVKGTTCNRPLSGARYGFFFALPNGKAAHALLACGLLHTSYSSAAFKLTPAAKSMLAKIEKQTRALVIQDIKATQNPHVSAVPCPAKMGVKAGISNSNRLLPHTVVAGLVCRYDHAKNEALTQVKIAHPRQFANLLNSNAMSAQQLHQQAMLCTADYWGADYMAQFTLEDGSSVTLDFACHGGAQGTYSSRFFYLGVKSARALMRLGNPQPKP